MTDAVPPTSNLLSSPLQTGVLAKPAGPRAILAYARAMGARVHTVALIPDPRSPAFQSFCAAIVKR